MNRLESRSGLRWRRSLCGAVMALSVVMLSAAASAQSAPLGDARLQSTFAPAPSGFEAIPAAVRDSAARGGPLASPVALRTLPRPTPLVPAPQDNMGAGQNVAMMVVGAAAIVTGAIIGGNGGTAIAVGGGVIGLVGLYRYMK